MRDVGDEREKCQSGKGRIGTCYVYICGGELTEFSLAIYMDLFCCLICLQTDLEKETAAGCYYRWKVMSMMTGDEGRRFWDMQYYVTYRQDSPCAFDLLCLAHLSQSLSILILPLRYHTVPPLSAIIRPILRRIYLQV